LSADARPSPAPIRRRLIIATLAILLVGGSAAAAWTWIARAAGPDAAASLVPSPSPAATPLVTPVPTPAPIPVALVPVTGPWSDETSITTAELAAALGGTAPTPRPVVIDAADLSALAEHLGVVPASNVRTMPASEIAAAVQAAPETLAFVRAEAVGLGERALAVDGVSLFGERHLTDLGAWPLLVDEPAGTTPTAFDPSQTWTMAAGGDVMLDRTVYLRAVHDALGPDYAWDGGFATITGTVCCGAPGLPLVRAERNGEPGALRSLLSGADLTLVNLEGPAPDQYVYHADGYIFTMDPALLTGLRDAGIDAVSLANNHIINAGQSGVVQTIANLDDLGIAHFGAGADITAASQPAWMTVHGLRIAILGYNDIRPDLGATATRAGAAPLDIAAAGRDIAAARAAGADLVVVMPHWGKEYTDVVTAKQIAAANGFIAAGADLVLGNHSHWAGPIAMVRDHLVVYSMGDFVFDLQHDVRTEEAIVVELTFSGRRLVQMTLHPTVILDRSQPNLLDPTTDGRPLLDAIRSASAGLLPW